MPVYNAVWQKAYPRLPWILPVLFIALYPLFSPLKFPYNLPVLAAAGLLLMYISERTVRPCGFRHPMQWRKMLLWIIAAFVSTELVFDMLLQPLMGWIFSEPADYSAFASLEGNTAKYGKYLLYAWLSAAMAEEIIYRGILIRLGEKLWGNTAMSVVMSSLLFALAHGYQGWSGIALTFLWGLAFAIIYLRCGRHIVVSIIVHGLVDSLFITLAYTGHLSYYASPLHYLFGFGS